MPEPKCVPGTSPVVFGSIELQKIPRKIFLRESVDEYTKKANSAVSADATSTPESRYAPGTSPVVLGSNELQKIPRKIFGTEDTDETAKRADSGVPGDAMGPAKSDLEDIPKSSQTVSERVRVQVGGIHKPI